MNKKKKMKKKKCLHGKPGDIPEKLNFTDTESYPSVGYDTDNLSKHTNFENDTASFDKTTVEFLQKLYFHRNVLKFILGCIPGFDD